MAAHKSIQMTAIDDQRERDKIARDTEQYIGTNWRISHHLNVEKDAQIMSTVPIFVWQRQGRNRAGLLILRADQPAIYWNTEQDQPYTIKLQVPATLTHKGTCILVATMSRVERLLTVEDIWAFEGTNLLKTCGYSERWPILEKVFYELNRQQYFLGADLQLIEPLSFNQFIETISDRPEDGSVWEFQPDVPLRRRLVWMLGSARSTASIGQNPAKDSFKTAQRVSVGQSADDEIADKILTNMQLQRSRGQIPTHVGALKPTTQPQPRIHKLTIEMQRCALLKPDKSTAMPDSYQLEADGGAKLGRICVPRLQQSHELKKAFTTCDELRVDVKWNTTFKKYEVSKILPAGTPLSPVTVFSDV
jgi:hypothetical protein